MLGAAASGGPGQRRLLQFLVARSTRMYSQEARVHVYILYVYIWPATQKMWHLHKRKQHQWPHPFHLLADWDESLFVGNTCMYDRDPSSKWPQALIVLSSWSLDPMGSQFLTDLHWVSGSKSSLVTLTVASPQVFWPLQQPDLRSSGLSSIRPRAMAAPSLGSRATCWLLWRGVCQR